MPSVPVATPEVPSAPAPAVSGADVVASPAADALPSASDVPIDSAPAAAAASALSADDEALMAEAMADEATEAFVVPKNFVGV